MLFIPSNLKKKSVAAMIAFMITLLASTTALAESKVVYSIGVVPQFEAKKLHAIWTPILNTLEKETGLKFKLIGSPTISGFEKEFLAGKFDFAYMNPYHLVWTHEAAGYIPMIRDHSKRLHGVLVVKKGGGIKSVEQLDGKKIAFPSPNALGASLMMRAELSRKFNLNIKPIYVKTHDSVYLNVVLGQTSAGGGVQKTLGRQNQPISDKLHVIYRTTKVAPHPFAYHPRIPKNIAMKVSRALLKMGESKGGSQLLSKIPIKKIGLATMEDYDPLTKMGLEEFRAD